MPVRFNYQDNGYQIRCSRCNASWLAQTQHDPNALDLRSHEPIAESIRYQAGRDHWCCWCRSCERAARASAPRTTNRAARRTAAALGERRKFGVELELKFPSRVTRDAITNALRDAGLTGWRAKGDGSLSGGNGHEIVGPPLAGEEGLEQLRIACRVLHRLGGVPDRQCGLHVHHDITDLTVDMVKRVAKTWKNQQPLIDGLVSASRRAAAGPTYCQPLQVSEIRSLDSCSTLAEVRSRGFAKYRTMNLGSYGRFGTVEIRQHQGTGDFEKIRSWVKLGQAIIDNSKTYDNPLPTQTRVRDLMTRLGDAMDETAATFCLGRAVQFGSVTV